MAAGHFHLSAYAVEGSIMGNSGPISINAEAAADRSEVVLGIGLTFIDADPGEAFPDTPLGRA